MNPENKKRDTGKSYSWDAVINRHYLGTVRAKTEEEAREKCGIAFGQYRRELIKLQRRGPK